MIFEDSNHEKQKILVSDDHLIYKYAKREGTGEHPEKGDRVSVHYVGYLESTGAKFDSSRERNEPFEFTIGENVIEGWNLGILTMKLGEISEFHIGSKYGYGSRGSPPVIPADAAVIFEIELLEIQMSKEREIVFSGTLCQEGTEAFRNQDFLRAMEKYALALQHISSYFGSDVQKMKIKYHNNISTCAIKLEKWSESIQHADDVLDLQPKDQKALFHKAEAQIALGQFTQAAKTIEDGMKINSAAFRPLKSKLTSSENANKKREDNLFKKMVGK